jgi:hypothetical protein
MGKFGKSLDLVKKEALKAWKKLANPTISRGKTAFPKSQKDQERLGVRLDYDGEVTKQGVQYHKYQIQPNAGKVPTSIEQWRKKNGGTHAVMGSIYVKKNGTEKEVDAGIAEGLDSIEGM